MIESDNNTYRNMAVENLPEIETKNFAPDYQNFIAHKCKAA